MILLAFAAVLILLSLLAVGPRIRLSRLLSDVRGELDLAALALKDRACDATNRIPTARWPLYSTTLVDSFAALAPAGTTKVLEFEAERDVLLTDLSIRVYDSVAGTALAASVSLESCNTTIIDGTDVGEFGVCCARKPFFLAGVRENKKLKFSITLARPAVAITNIELSLTGFQGDGCCA